MSTPGPSHIDDERVAMLIREGLSTRTIADMMGCTVRTIERSRTRLGLVGPPPLRYTADELATVERLLDDGASITEAARTVGRSRVGLQKRFPGRCWTKAEAGAWGGMMSAISRATR